MKRNSPQFFIVSLTIAFQCVLAIFSCTENHENNWHDPPRIHPAGMSAWGPDDWIVFLYEPWYVSNGDTFYVEDCSVLWLIKPDGKGLHSIGDRETPDGVFLGVHLNWSPDGNWIIMNDLLGRIWLMSADGDSLETIPTEGRRFHPSFSPDGNKIAFSTPDSDAIGTRGIRILYLDTHEEKFVFPYGIDPSWSPDGGRLVLKGWVHEGDQWVGGPSGSVVVVDTSGENAKIVHLDDTGYGVESPSYSPDGSKIVFTQFYVDGGIKSQIWVIKTDGSGARRLTSEGARWPAWNPDGSRIVYTRYSLDDLDMEGNGELYIVDSYGLWRKRLTYLNY